MADVFLSYKKRDRELVESLAKALTAEGFTVWWDYDIETGDDWLRRILLEVAVARCLVGVWTRNSVDGDGMFVAGEDGTSYVRMEHERAGIAKIAGALFDRRAVPAAYSAAQFADMADWTPGDRRHEGFRGLVSYLEKKAMPAFAARRVVVLEAELQRAQEEAGTARAQAETWGEQFQAATREVVGLRQSLADAEKRLRESAGWEGREAEAKRAVADLQSRLRVAEGALGEARAAGAAAADRAKQMEARAKQAEALVAAAEREAKAARGSAAASAGAARLLLPAVGAGALGWVLAVGAGAAWMSAGSPAAEEPPLVAEPTGPSRCGDALEGPGEQCDFGDAHNDGRPGGCTAECKLPWVTVPAGVYTIGNDDAGRDRFEPRPHDVRAPVFDVATTEVTRAQKRRFGAPAAGDFVPWTSVNWYEAGAFCEALDGGARLPTEAEWEIAARGGATGAWPCGGHPSCLDTASWYAGNAGGAVHPVGVKYPTGVGVYDIAGNASEWTADCHDYVSYGRVAEAQQSVEIPECSSRVVRGGSYGAEHEILRSGRRGWSGPEGVFDYLGFRCVRGSPRQEIDANK